MLTCLKALTTPHLLCRFGKAVRSPCMDLGSQASGSTDEHDLSCTTGVKEFLEKCETKYITKERMKRNFFTLRLDGQRHAWLHALKQSHCQYCHYVRANEFDDAQKISFKYKRQNKKRNTMVCTIYVCPAPFLRWEYFISRRFAERISSGTCHVHTLQRNF